MKLVYKLQIARRQRYGSFYCRINMGALGERSFNNNMHDNLYQQYKLRY